MEEKLPGYRAKCHDTRISARHVFWMLAKEYVICKGYSQIRSVMQIAPQSTHALYLLNQLPRCQASVLKILISAIILVIRIILFPKSVLNISMNLRGVWNLYLLFQTDTFFLSALVLKTMFFYLVKTRLPHFTSISHDNHFLCITQCMAYF